MTWNPTGQAPGWTDVDTAGDPRPRRNPVPPTTDPSSLRRWKPRPGPRIPRPLHDSPCDRSHPDPGCWIPTLGIPRPSPSRIPRSPTQSLRADPASGWTGTRKRRRSRVAGRPSPRPVARSLLSCGLRAASRFTRSSRCPTLATGPRSIAPEREPMAAGDTNSNRIANDSGAGCRGPVATGCERATSDCGAGGPHRALGGRRPGRQARWGSGTPGVTGGFPMIDNA